MVNINQIKKKVINVLIVVIKLVINLITKVIYVAEYVKMNYIHQMKMIVMNIV